MSSSRHVVRNVPSSSSSRNVQNQSSENEVEKQLNAVHFPVQRSPLNTIPDPSQLQREFHEFDYVTRGGQSLDTAESAGAKCDAPRVLSRHGNGTGREKGQSEPSTAQSTPVRSGCRASLGGASSAGPRMASQFTGGRGIGSSSYSRVARVFFTENSNVELDGEVANFELAEDPVFWKDHNVQVLIRIRPLSSMERASQGYGRCLKQESAHTLAWLGHPETRFTFDHIACETISQEKLFRVAGLPMVENCMSGYNSCMFAYGQTGSGKTYTMMGEIQETDGNLKDGCGITPRIFEYLFSRIRMAEENRRDEKLKYICKCSFLEIYNEQITDLLEPSSNNLQLREDLKKGVYVENLRECCVRTVSDVLKLLLQGAANRKMAATYMNSQSSRSHSVFTCIIESQWETDSMTHFRFARLNLVDLAGSERQKSSGAEGERLKEAANINKSLSTLGLVIMSLVDLAHGKHRHVPYRDSRLTFLLQDSLGGNSKTTIISNVSPSTCSANETLSTLKFAQRAKLIQNNAKVNEDASGDVTALQRQIQRLKGQLSFLKKHHNNSSSLSQCLLSSGESKLNEFSEIYDPSEERRPINNSEIHNDQKRKLKCVESTLIVASRRDKMAATALQKLEVEIEHINCFACKREEEMRHMKMILRYREEKIKQLELFVAGLLPAERYLEQENAVLKEEIQLLQARIANSPEVTCAALENIRLLEQFQLFKSFYQKGERETLLAEVSELHGELLETIEEKLKFSAQYENQDIDTLKELKHCRSMNAKLIREVLELRRELGKHLSHATYDSVIDSFSMEPEELTHADKCSMVVDRALQNKSHHNVVNTLVPSDIQEELIDSTSLIEAKEMEQVRLIENMQLMQEQNLSYVENQREGWGIGCSENGNRTGLQAKVDKLTKDLVEAKLMNYQYEEDHAAQLSHQLKVKLTHEEVEMETTRTILQLQEEVADLQLELQQRLCTITQENIRLKDIIAAKEEEINALCMEWERATVELTSFLVDGSRSLKDASGQIKSIASSFPLVNAWIGEHVEKAARVWIEKEEMILLLQKSLEDAQKMVVEMELKLNSLKGATVAWNEFQQPDNDYSLGILLNDKINLVKVLEHKLKLKEDQIIEAEKCATAAFLVIKWLSGCHDIPHRKAIGRDSANDIQGHTTSETNAAESLLAFEAINPRVAVAGLGILETGNAMIASYADSEVHITNLLTQVSKASSAYIKVVQDLVNEIREMRNQVIELKENDLNFQSSEVKLQLLDEHEMKFESQFCMLHQIRDDLAQTNNRLNRIIDCIITNTSMHSCLLMDKDLIEPDACSTGYTIAGSDVSSESVASGEKSDTSAYVCCSKLSGRLPEQMGWKYQEGSGLQYMDQSSEKSQKLLANSNNDEAAKFCLVKELNVAVDTVNRLSVWLSAILENKNADCFSIEEMKPLCPSFVLRMPTAEAGCHSTGEVISDEKINYVRGFFTNIEEAHVVIKQADYMLNALLKANEDAKQVNAIWKQASEELTVDRARLIEENEQLKSSMSLKEEENRLLHDQIHHSTLDIANALSLLESSFLKMQKEVENMFKVLYSVVSSMGREMLRFISNSRLSLEDTCSEIMERGFSQFVLFQCLVEEFILQILNFKEEPGFYTFRQKESYPTLTSSQNICLSGNYSNSRCIEEICKGELVQDPDQELGISWDKLIYENLSLKKGLERKEVLLEGLLFDFSLLQESASNSKDIKDETEELILALSRVQHELETKTTHLDELLVQQKKFEGQLVDTENDLLISNSDLEQAKEMLSLLSDQNAELRMLLKDFYLKKSEAEGQLEEQKEVVKNLENEILHLTSLVDEKIHSYLEGVNEDLEKVTNERDQLSEEVCSLSYKLEMAYALAEENEAIAVEACQESEASKIYAEQKEEEVKILEHSVEELENTINILEKKVYEMDNEVGKYHLIRDSLEEELQALRARLLVFERFTNIVESDDQTAQETVEQTSRQWHDKLLELHEANSRIGLLEMERAEQEKVIKQFKDYISELVLHSEAQASQYQEKYKSLEAMFQDSKTDISNSTSTTPLLDKDEKVPMRTRGSSSPFRCITTLVQQMNVEKEHELSAARLHVEELEALAANRLSEVCMLNTRLAAAESMVHDVIRDLLGVKLDMTNYANLVDQHWVQKLLEDAHQQGAEVLAKEQEILNFKMHINDLTEERESYISEIQRKEADILAAQMTIEQLKERDQLLTAQNEMLKVDKSSLNKRATELDEMVKRLLVMQSTHEQVKQTARTEETGALNLGDPALTKMLLHSERLMSRVNDGLPQCLRLSSNHSHVKSSRPGLETRHRK
ncbi:kinesin-like protein KIN-12C isoform X2 [Tripterygium wilfordii]|uniref:kinesin-like protein KIN-12C isoform X2 n=1 Tax=Tripterygium wilfordii TaxID=458696 RepID=UPI0018F82A86|nr:kinesin-like protein KIN-12C isoform X2 [Tripterygium wilfordii]